MLNNYWDFFKRKAGLNTSLKARVSTCLSEIVSAVSFLKTLGYLYEAFEIREKGTSSEKVTFRDEKKDVDKICIEVHAVSHFNKKHLVLCTTPKSFRTTVKESLKRTTTSKWATLTKSRIVRRVKYFHAFVSTLNHVSPIGAKGVWIDQLNSKNNGSVLLFKTIFWHW